MCWPTNRSPTRSSWKLPNNQGSPILQDGGFCMVSKIRVGAALAAAHPDMHVGDQGRPQGSPLRALTHRRERRRRRFGTVFGRGAGAPHPTERRGRRSLRAKIVGTPLPGCPVCTDSSRRGCPCGSPPRHACRGQGRPQGSPLRALIHRRERRGRRSLRAKNRRDTPPGVSVSAPQAEGPGKNHHVIARPKAVAISWKNLRIRSQ